MLRFRNEKVFHDLDGVIREIVQCLSFSPDSRCSRRAEEFCVGDEIVANEVGDLAVIGEIEFCASTEIVFDLIVDEDHSFVTESGVTNNRLATGVNLKGHPPRLESGQ